ncbi:MAG: aminotransferase class I/II-fold pyridoxal phosphate-dependent enzyme [Collinsella sp.]
MPAGVREAVDAALAATPLNRYPDPMSNDLRDELAAWHGVTRENICVGNGGDELLYNYLLAFGGAGRTLLNCPPCFSEYAFFASLCQTEVRDVWRDPASFELDQAAVLAAAPACNLAIVTSPNNPTGDVARSTLSRLCAMRAPAWLWSTRPTLSLPTICLARPPRRRALSPSIPTW